MMNRTAIAEANVPPAMQPLVMDDRALDDMRRRFAPQLALADACCIIVFTDVVCSTDLVETLGDVAAAELLDRHARAVRRALEAHGGVEIRSRGDGFVVSFGSPSRALRFALQVREELAELSARSPGMPLQIRTGVHAGEPVAGEELQGLVLHKAARIMSSAAPAQILVSDVVRQLADGKRFAFAEHGELALRGCAAPVRVHELCGEIERPSPAVGAAGGHTGNGTGRTARPDTRPGLAPPGANGAPAPAIDVLVMHAQRMVREGLVAILERERDLRVVGSIDGWSAAPACERAPDVVLVEVGGAAGLETVRRLRAALPQAAILGLGIACDRAAVAAAMRAGMRGYVVQRCTAAELVRAVRAVGHGGWHVDTTITRTLVERLAATAPPAHSPDRLTEREREILQLVAESHTTREIARELGITPKTVETHRLRLMRKLDLHNTAAVVRYAIGNGVAQAHT